MYFPASRHTHSNQSHGRARARRVAVRVAVRLLARPRRSPHDAFIRPSPRVSRIVAPRSLGVMSSNVNNRRGASSLIALARASRSRVQTMDRRPEGGRTRRIDGLLDDDARVLRARGRVLRIHSDVCARASAIVREHRRDSARKRRGCVERSGGGWTRARGIWRLTARVDALGRRFLHVMYGTSVLCCWFMWAVIYIAQMHPLVRPVMNRAE